VLLFLQGIEFVEGAESCVYLVNGVDLHNNSGGSQLVVQLAAAPFVLSMMHWEMSPAIILLPI